MAYRNSERPLLQDGKTMQISNYMADKFEEQKSVPVNFVGSIAFYLKDELKMVLEKYGYTMGNALRRPADGLIAFHSK